MGRYLSFFNALARAFRFGNPDAVEAPAPPSPPAEVTSKLRVLMADPTAPKPATGPQALPEKWVEGSQLLEMKEWITARNPDYFKDSLIQFEESYLRLTFKIREACAQGRFEEAGEAAHALKGICFTLGLRRMGEICRGLEAMSLGGLASRWSNLLEELEAAKEPSLEEWRRWTSD